MEPNVLTGREECTVAVEQDLVRQVFVAMASNNGQFNRAWLARRILGVTRGDVSASDDLRVQAAIDELVRLGVAEPGQRRKVQLTQVGVRLAQLSHDAIDDALWQVIDEFKARYGDDWQSMLKVLLGLLLENLVTNFEQLLTHSDMGVGGEADTCPPAVASVALTPQRIRDLIAGGIMYLSVVKGRDGCTWQELQRTCLESGIPDHFINEELEVIVGFLVEYGLIIVLGDVQERRVYAYRDAPNMQRFDGLAYVLLAGTPNMVEQSGVTLQHLRPEDEVWVVRPNE